MSHGVAIGEVRHMGTAVLEPPAKQIPPQDAEREQGRARQAVEAVAADLIARGNLAGGEAQGVLEAQAMMAQDPELMSDVERRIAVGSTAERAVYDAFAAYRALLAGAGEYLAGRVADLDDVRNRIVARLLGVPMPGVPDSDEPYVLIARDLAPADTALLDPSLVLGFVTEEGGPTSHSAILARALGVPAVVALPGAGELAEGTLVAVDGSTGEIFVEPTQEKRSQMERAAAERKAALAASTGPGATSDGHKVPLLANVGGPADVPAALDAGAEGVGLFRTEFLFLDDSSRAPSEEKQVEAYRQVLEAFPEGRVVVRVLDAGADKPLDFLTPADEPNPALGVRGCARCSTTPRCCGRSCRRWRRRPGGFPSISRSWPRWSPTGPTRRRSPTRAGMPGWRRSSGRWWRSSAALRARSILQEVEFLSLGTNDLAQYTFAADRQVGAVSRLQDPWQPALLDLVALSAEAAKAEGKSCGVCGEAASDPLLACVLTGLGVTSLSMGAASIPYVRATLAKYTLAQCERAAAAARAADTAEEARAAAQAVLSGE
ncbi:phosphoenolpyruvate--protein phosphotransferase [Streptomyces zhihengii]